MSLLRIAPWCIALLSCAPAAAVVARQDRTNMHGAVQLRPVKGDPKSHDASSIDVNEIVKELSALNASYEKVGNVVDYVNETAMQLLSQVATVIDAFQAVLPALQMAVNAMKIVPGSDDLVDWAASFIDTANKTVYAFDDQIATIPDTVGKALDEIMPEFQELMDKVFSEFVDAAEQVAALQNATEELRRIAAPHVTPEVEGGFAHDGRVGKRHQKAKPEASDNDISLLMQSRALRTHAQITLESETVDSTVLAKGSSECSKAKSAIKKANASVGEYADDIASLNVTAFNLLGQVLGTAGSGLELLNATVMTAIEPAQLKIPASILEPITKGLAALMEIMDSLIDTVNEASPEIEEQIIEAQGPLDAVIAVADELRATADQACAH